MVFDDLPLVLAQGGEGAPSGGGSNQGQPATPPATEGQDGSPQSGQQGQQGQGNGGGGGFLGFPVILLLVLGVMVVLMMTSQRREKKRKQEIQSALKKGAKVQTAGGILGTVIEVRDEEVIVKVDESANTRLRFARSAIQSVQASDNGDDDKNE
jgi:preprotein translocase subunit YajC